MCVIKVLNPQILCSTGIFTVTQRMYSMYLFSVFFFLGMPDKESMSSSALCQVSKNCSKVNHTQFCLFLLEGEEFGYEKCRIIQHSIENN